MAAMQGQIEQFVATLNHEFTLQSRRSAEGPQHSLIPVIQLTAMVRQDQGAKKRRK
jgi:hypothetical protein